MRVTILLFDDLTALDAIGPYEVLSRVPGWQVQFVAESAGPLKVDSGATSITATASFGEVEQTDILLIPGGIGSRQLMKDEATLAWIRKAAASAKWITSVCTGALLLGAAGLLERRRATTHWLSLDRLRELGAIPVAERVVIDGNVVTAAGVSSGIDMALTLVGQEAGPEAARAIQLAIEYDPQPPYDSGSPTKASPATIEIVTAGAAKQDHWLAQRRK